MYFVQSTEYLLLELRRRRAPELQTKLAHVQAQAQAQVHSNQALFRPAPVAWARVRNCHWGSAICWYAQISGNFHLIISSQHGQWRHGGMAAQEPKDTVQHYSTTVHHVGRRGQALQRRESIFYHVFQAIPSAWPV